jgi:hypothetical protein
MKERGESRPLTLVRRSYTPVTINTHHSFKSTSKPGTCSPLKLNLKGIKNDKTGLDFTRNEILQSTVLK